MSALGTGANVLGMSEIDREATRLAHHVSRVAAGGQVPTEEYIALYKLLAAVHGLAYHRLVVEAMCEDEDPDAALDPLRRLFHDYFRERGA